MNPETISIREVKISVSELKVGMYVCRLDKDWVESAFVFQGFVITNEKIIQKLAKECEYVYIDEQKGVSASKIPSRKITIKKETQSKKSFFGLGGLFARKKAANLTRKETFQLKDIVARKVVTQTIKPPPKLHTFDEELNTAKEAYSSAGTLIKDFMLSVKQGGAIDIIVAKHAVYDCMTSILRSPDAMLLLNRLKSKDYNLWQHSMNVSVLAINLGRYLNLHDDELVLLGLCGMFHDIGKLRLSKSAITESHDREAVIRTHPHVGREILTDCMGQLAEVASEVAYTHHENLDGSGYPRGLGGEQISPYTRMISIVNQYDNLITDKATQKGMTHYEAMVILLERAHHQLDETLVNSFNQCMGVYPVGCVVELNTGEIAMVVEENEKQRLRPKIMLLTTASKIQRERTVVNLADSEFTKSSDAYFIKALVRADAYGIKI